jgi:hypothetical protein
MGHKSTHRKTDWVFLSPFIVLLGLPLLAWILAPHGEGRCGFELGDGADHAQLAERSHDE